MPNQCNSRTTCCDSHSAFLSLSLPHELFLLPHASSYLVGSFCNAAPMLFTHDLLWLTWRLPFSLTPSRVVVTPLLPHANAFFKGNSEMPLPFSTCFLISAFVFTNNAIKFVQHLVFSLISAFYSSHIKPEFLKTVLLSQIHIIARWNSHLCRKNGPTKTTDWGR